MNVGTPQPTNDDADDVDDEGPKSPKRLIRRLVETLVNELKSTFRSFSSNLDPATNVACHTFPVTAYCNDLVNESQIRNNRRLFTLCRSVTTGARKLR